MELVSKTQRPTSQYSPPFSELGDDRSIDLYDKNKQITEQTTNNKHTTTTTPVLFFYELDFWSEQPKHAVPSLID
jgi:hypothetical protein